MDDYPFDTPTYRAIAKGKALPDFITGRAVGNPLAVREHSAANLSAQGFGSTTFRPRASQLVTADAAWSNGQWTVVLRRPLDVTPEDGLALGVGERYSMAFAVWDGAARDRGGQKLISIWNDFQLQ